MNLPSTGFLDFAWPSGTGAEAYSFKAYKNNAFYDNFYTTHTGIRVSGLIEGDAMYGYVYPYINGNISSSFQIVEEQTVPVAWFDETFSFDFISVDQNNISLSNNFGESSYTEGRARINFDLINPRTSGVITGFDSDPLLSSVVYESRYSDTTSIESFNLSNNSFISRNSSKLFRIYTASIIVEDYHGRLITGDIELSNSPIQINSIDYQFVSGNDTTQELLFHSDYSASCIKVDYFTYDSNELTGQYLSSGESHTPNNYSMSIDNGFSGAILIIPHDWFGSGDYYLIKDFSLAEQVETEYINNIDYLNLEGSDYGSFMVSSDYISNHSSGSYFHLSINDSTGSHFTESALYTGAFNDLSSGIDFNYFNTLTTSDTDNLTKLYHINVQLYKSGSQKLEDERSVSGSYDIPHFNDSDIAFDYALGVTTTSFDVSSTLDFTGISVLYSGKDATGYSPAVDYSLETGSIETTTSFKLVRSNDRDFIFDELYVSGSGQSMSPNISMGQFTTTDALFPVYITNNNPGVAINQLHKYGRFSFKDVSDGDDILPASYSGILNFEDFTSHALGVHFLGSSFLPAPTGLARNQEYSIEGTDCIYESGLHYMYRFVPENGYGTGEPSDVLYAEFPLNNFTQYIDGNQVATDQSIASIQSDFASQVYVDNKTSTTNSHINAGSNINLDTSISKNFIIDNDNQSNLSMNFNNLSLNTFDSSVYILNAVNPLSLTSKINSTTPTVISSGSFGNSNHLLKCNMVESSLNNWILFINIY